MIFKESYRKVFGEDELFKNYNYLLVNKMQNNIKSITIHDFNIPRIVKNSFKRCGNNRCVTCLFANFSDRIVLSNGFYLPI